MPSEAPDVERPTPLPSNAPEWVKSAVHVETIGENQGSVADAMARRGLSTRTLPFIATYYVEGEGRWDLYDKGFIVHYGPVDFHIMQAKEKVTT